jgi:SAM-dependent methyltransferase
MPDIISESGWLATPLGGYLLGREKAMYDHAVTDIFGFNAVQLGLGQLDLLEQSRMPFKCKTTRESGAFHCQYENLPLATSSVDLILMPHLLEFSANPHQVLRDAERALVPEGHLIISGFNPISLWGLRQLCCNKQGYPWHGRFISLMRLKDWCALLGLEVVAGRMGCYVPPFAREKWLARMDWMDRAGDRWWPMMGGVYFIVARKKVTGMRLIKPNWNQAPMVRVFMPKPTQKTECQKEMHGD